MNDETYMYVFGIEPERSNLPVRILLSLNDVAYMYVSDTEPECCNLHVLILY
jgi:hypothetical protein